MKLLVRLLMIVGVGHCAASAQAEEEFTGQQWLQRAINIQAGQTTDELRANIRQRFSQADFDGGGVSEKDLELVRR